ncbi:hypothetical protein B0H67DRAFT_550603 [Lasiosphaeris hirsuta]|uniref:Uncharacterized protein n=1 Tax=Lasiosphaeris hirsuta TaxID=260670 RepID=A0AA40E4N5_9PEZI|nr:hypothetical protein B0H67DRAFT_550603 [Lasiosphaeris hirsuta]
MPLPEREDNNKKLTPSEIARQLEPFRQGAAEYIAPQSAPGCLPEMRCFDPNRCRCLRYVGTGEVPWKLGSATFSDTNNQSSTCRTNADCQLGPLLPSRAGNRHTTKGTTGSHTSRTVLSSWLEIPYGIRVDVDPCPGGGPCLGVTYQRTILAAAGGVPCRGVTQSWLEALDPDSYRSQMVSKDGKGAWDGLSCRDDPCCPNYFRYLERPVLMMAARQALYAFSVHYEDP